MGKQNWIKRGFIYKPSGKLDWSKSHAQVPIADYDANTNSIKVYYSTRDSQSRSLPSYVVLDADNPSTVISECSAPILELGKLGTFDDCGVMPSWIVNDGARKLMYYIGWNVRNTIPYHNAIGLAISDDGGDSWRKFSEGPIMDRTHIEPQYSGTSCVILENGVWKNWYLSCTEWIVVDGKSEPRYHIKYAESKDGINWERKGIVAIDYASKEEAGIVKASVVHEDGIYKMWFAFRKLHGYRSNANASYRIGYAESKDGIQWKRETGTEILDVSEGEFDSMMTAYPHVIDVKGKCLMFYNGDGFGKSGFGYAELIR